MLSAVKTVLKVVANMRLAALPYKGFCAVVAHSVNARCATPGPQSYSAKLAVDNVASSIDYFVRCPSVLYQH
ncbi:hypothetical protein CCHOA_09785 [Corynebacterium choanae]|uniref:Uncharacterized protein n=1 Tax=Corynebacterium choanae TaxID=1862358 RepID=A0A3G6JCE5_9CORY|nr:hypothetical protein CCHOA_09785 [Corynebacterium choanae]